MCPAGGCLRVSVDHEHPGAGRRRPGGHVEDSGGLADPALLIGDREDAHDMLTVSQVADVM